MIFLRQQIFFLGQEIEEITELEIWEGIQALRPVELMPARLMLVTARQLMEVCHDKAIILGGNSAYSDTVVLTPLFVSGLGIDTAGRPLDSRWRLQSCYFN